MVGEVNKVVFREREELVIGSSSWLDEKGGGKACSRLFVRSTGNGSVGTIVLGVESHENELAFRLPFYCILCILRIVIERERERLQGTNVIIDLSRHNERSRARFSNPSLPPLALSKTPRILLELASPVPEEFAIQLGREYYWVKGEEYLEEY